MDFPFLLLVLLALPIVTALLIVSVSAVRRRRRSATDEPGHPDAHRLQSDTAAVQDAAKLPGPYPPAAVSGRSRRAASAAGRTHDEVSPLGL